MTRSGEEAEGKNAVGSHGIDRSDDEVLRGSGVLHVAKVAQEGESAEATIEEQPLPVGALVATGGECNLPGVGRGQLTGDEPPPDQRLIRGHRLGVGEEEHVAKANCAGTVVLGERVLVEAGERCGEPLLHLRGERLAPLGPVDGDELGELVGTLDDAHEGLGHKSAVSGMTRHLAHQKQRRVTKLHRSASLYGEGRDLLGRNRGDELADASRDGYAFLVELVLPEHAGEYRTPQCLLRRDDGRACAFMSARASEMGQLEDVQLHVVAPPFVRVGENSPGNKRRRSELS